MCPAFVYLFVPSTFQGVFDIDPEKGLILKEIADGVSLQDIVESTGCEFQVKNLSFSLQKLNNPRINLSLKVSEDLEPMGQVQPMSSYA